MAETQLERKRRFPVWIWLAVAVLLAALAWWLVTKRQETGGTAGAPGPLAESGVPAVVLTIPPEIVELQGYVAQPPVAPDQSHQFTADALRKLASAIDAAQPSLRGTLQSESIKRYADQLQADSASLEHARIARTAFLTATSSIEQIQRQGFPALADQVKDLRAAAEAIDPQKPLLSQTNQTQAFLERSSQLLVLIGHTEG